MSGDSDKADDGPGYLPIAQFAKSKLVNFDLRDMDGTAIPMLTAEQNGKLSTELLSAFARLYGDDKIDPLVERYIPRLVNARSNNDRSLAWHRIFEPGTSVGASLRDRPALVAIADNLRRNFVLYLPVVAEEVGTRKIVKLAFDAPRSAVDVSGFRARLGWSAVEDTFRVPLAGFSCSYHFELEAPPDMEITRGRFFGTQNNLPAEDRLATPTGRAHFNLSRLDPSDAFVTVALRARSRELLGGAALFSSLNALTLLFVLLRLRGFHEEHGTDAVVAALLAIPGILIGYTTRPSEHEVLISFLTDLRRTAPLSGITSFVAALVLFAGFSEQALHAIFAVLLAFSVGTAGVLVTSWIARRR